LFPALWIPDLFMKRVQEDADWTLFDPNEVNLHEIFGEEFESAYVNYESDPSVKKEVISAKGLWKKILTAYFETGNPFLTFKDTSNIRNSNDHAGIIRSSNLCLEIFQNTSPDIYGISLEFDNGDTIIFKEDELIEVYETDTLSYTKMAKKINNIDSIIVDGEIKKVIFSSRIVIEAGETAVCNLGSVNLSRIHTKEDMQRVVPVAIRALDNVIDLNFYPVKKALKTNLNSRSIGLGVMGEAEMIAKKQIHFGSNEHLVLIDEVMEYFSYFAIDASAELAKENDWAIDWIEAMAYAASQSVEKYKALVAEMNLLEPQTGFFQTMFACGFMATEGKDYNERAKNFYAKHYRD
jgi:ribonucleoside-diphosphate reductase alpha chain